MEVQVRGRRIPAELDNDIMWLKIAGQDQMFACTGMAIGGSCPDSEIIIAGQDAGFQGELAPIYCNDLVDFIKLHDSTAANELEEKTAIVKFADLLAHMAGIGSPEGYPERPEVIKDLARYLSFDQDDLDQTVEEIIEKTKEQFAAEGSIYA